MCKKDCYCHFAFRRPRDYGGYALFSAVIFADKDGKRKVSTRVAKQRLWEDQQHITAIQSYEFALRCIWELQGDLIEHGVGRVLLVTDNSNLAGWIVDINKNRKYTSYMKQASAKYAMGGEREIVIDVGLCEVRNYEKAHKYCKEQFITNVIESTPRQSTGGTNVVDLDESNLKSALDLMAEEEVKVYGLEVK